MHVGIRINVPNVGGTVATTLILYIIPKKYIINKMKIIR